MTHDVEPVSLRVMTVDDIPDGLRLSGAAGWNQRAEDWLFLLERNPGRFVVARRGDRVVGTGGAVCYGPALAWVCMILVDAHERGRGIGTRLVQGVLDRVTEIPIVGLDATPHGQGVYARLGFVETGRLSRMEAPGSVTARDPGGGAGARPIAAGDLERVLALDREVFGADRSALLRWAAARAPALCVEQGRAIAGYCFGRRGTRARQIGPVVAHDVSTARALLAASMSAGQGDRVVVDVPAGRSDWVASLEEMGFAVQRPLVRMFRASRPPGRPDEQLAIFGPEFG